MIGRLVIAVVVAIVVSLGLTLLGSILVSLNVSVAPTVGTFLEHYNVVLGVLAGLASFFGGFNPIPPRNP